MKKIYTLIGAILLTLNVSAQTTERVTLVETFTSSTCGPCYNGNIVLENLLAQPGNADKFVSVKYQVEWPGSGDPYFHSDVNSRRGFYSVSSVPRTFLDKNFDNNPSIMTQTDLDGAFGVEAFVEIDAYFQMNVATQTVDIQVDINALQDVPGGTFLYVAVCERVSTNNVKTNGETEFYNVCKKMVPSAAGTYVGAIDAGTSETFNLSYTFNGTYILPPNALSPVDHSTNHIVEDFNDLRVAVWLQRSSSKEVYQAAYAKKGYAGVEETESTMNNFNIYPNPAVDRATVSYTISQPGNMTIRVVDILGKVIHSNTWFQESSGNYQYQLNTSEFANGIYLVEVQSESGTQTKKLQIKK